jgi:hypothetical protein
MDTIYRRRHPVSWLERLLARLSQGRLPAPAIKVDFDRHGPHVEFFPRNG